MFARPRAPTFFQRGRRSKRVPMCTSRSRSWRPSARRVSCSTWPARVDCSSALAQRLLDIPPHRLSTLIAALEEVTADPGSIEVAAVVAEPVDLHVVLRVNDTYGRLNVSLRARPVGSTLVVAGTGGTLTADFL